MKKENQPKKRNPQDATRNRDVSPVRRRVERLELQVRSLAWAVTKLENKAYGRRVKR